VTLSVTNRMNLSSRSKLFGTAALALKSFNERRNLGERTDTLISLGGTYMYQWKKNYTLLAEAKVIQNSSSDSQYKYNRLVVSGGLSYSIF